MIGQRIKQTNTGSPRRDWFTASTCSYET